jgi:MHS family alpha-ketoglutarate permease-like MFS transporter
VIGALAALGALYLRTHMGETAAFEQQQNAVSASPEGEG